MNDDWSLKDKKFINKTDGFHDYLYWKNDCTWLNDGDVMYREYEINTLRKKIIDDIRYRYRYFGEKGIDPDNPDERCIPDADGYFTLDQFFRDIEKYVINKRFGVDTE